MPKKISVGSFLAAGFWKVVTHIKVPFSFRMAGLPIDAASAISSCGHPGEHVMQNIGLIDQVTASSLLINRG
uniref:Uncharacterized protein n=1 Tax=Solanum lycopersicum TaxID=4081 RepID=A0A3Q7J8I9_SOLLC